MAAQIRQRESRDPVPAIQRAYEVEQRRVLGDRQFLTVRLQEAVGHEIAGERHDLADEIDAVPLPPYIVPSKANNAWFWLIARSCPSACAEPPGAKLPAKVRIEPSGTPPGSTVGSELLAGKIPESGSN